MNISDFQRMIREDIDDPELRNIAQKILDYKLNQEITKEEFDILVDDLIKSVGLDSEFHQLEGKIAVRNFYSFLAMLRTWAIV